MEEWVDKLVGQGDVSIRLLRTQVRIGELWHRGYKWEVRAPECNWACLWTYNTPEEAYAGARSTLEEHLRRLNNEVTALPASLPGKE